MKDVPPLLRWTLRLSLVIWFGAFGLWFQYDGTRPTTPQIESGRVYALNTHSHIVYLTMAECVRLYGLMAIGCATLLAETCDRLGVVNVERLRPMPSSASANPSITPTGLSSRSTMASARSHTSIATNAHSYRRHYVYKQFPILQTELAHAVRATSVRARWGDRVFRPDGPVELLRFDN
jgi:hypothetical protein